MHSCPVQLVGKRLLVGLGGWTMWSRGLNRRFTRVDSSSPASSASSTVAAHSVLSGLKQMALPCGSKRWVNRTCANFLFQLLLQNTSLPMSHAFSQPTQNGTHGLPWKLKDPR